LLAQVKNRLLIIGEPWEVLTRITALDMTDQDWQSQLRLYPESDTVLATPEIEVVMEDDDTLVYVRLADDVTVTFNPGIVSWGLKADDHSLYFGYLNVKQVPVR
jgi:hypothetical protein